MPGLIFTTHLWGRKFGFYTWEKVRHREIKNFAKDHPNGTASCNPQIFPLSLCLLLTINILLLKLAVNVNFQRSCSSVDSVFGAGLWVGLIGLGVPHSWAEGPQKVRCKFIFAFMGPDDLSQLWLLPLVTCYFYLILLYPPIWGPWSLLPFTPFVHPHELTPLSCSFCSQGLILTMSPPQMLSWPCPVLHYWFLLFAQRLTFGVWAYDFLLFFLMLYFFWYLNLKSGCSHLLGKFSTTWVMSPALFAMVIFFSSTAAWTQSLHLEPLHQPFLVMGFFSTGSHKLFA
jgi:hypothetical protein